MKVKFVIKYITLAFLMTGYVIMVFIFMTAYDNESKSVVVDINAQGEATFEFWLLLVSIPIVFGGVFLIFDSIEKKGVKEE